MRLEIHRVTDNNILTQLTELGTRIVSLLPPVCRALRWIGDEGLTTQTL